MRNPKQSNANKLSRAEPPALNGGSPNRVLGLEGAANFRDIGGYITSKGRRVRWGRVYRSNRLSELSPADCARLDARGLATIFDLRVEKERAQDPTCWSCEGLAVRTYPPGRKKPLVEMAARYQGDEAGAQALMAEFYASLPHTLAHVFGAVVRDLAGGAAPCVIHCSAGKDRTGIAVALILLALGVPRETVVEDYALTDSLRRPDTDMTRAVAPGRQDASVRSRFSPEAVAVMMSAPPRFIETAFASMEERYGSIDSYLRSALDLDAAILERLKAELLER